MGEMAIGNQEEDRMSENEGTSKRARGGWISGSQPSELCVFSFFFSHFSLHIYMFVVVLGLGAIICNENPENVSCLHHKKEK